MILGSATYRDAELLVLPLHVKQAVCVHACVCRVKKSRTQTACCTLNCDRIACSNYVKKEFAKFVDTSTYQMQIFAFRVFLSSCSMCPCDCGRDCICRCQVVYLI